MSRQPFKILIIDQNAEKRARLKTHLMHQTEADYVFLEADTAESLEIDFEEKPDCILLGCPFPEEEKQSTQSTGASIAAAKSWFEQEDRPHDNLEFTLTVLKTLPSVMYTLNLRNKTNTFLTEHAALALGYPFNELQNSEIDFLQKYMHPEDIAAAENHFRKIAGARNGEVFEFEYRMLHKSGEWRWFKSRDRVFRRDAEGRAEEILGIATDITEGKMAEAALRESEERYRAFVQASAQIEWTADAAGKFVKKQTSWEAFTGQKFDEYRDDGWLRAVHPDDRSSVESAWKNALTDKRVYEIEERLRRRDGEYRWVQARAVPLFDKSGAVREWVGTSTDITTRKQAEEQLRHNHETFFNLVKNTPFGIFLIDGEFRLIEISAGSQKVFSGIDPLIGRDFAEILRIIWDEPFATEVIAIFRRTLATGEAYQTYDTTERRNNLDHIESYDWKIERITLPDGGFAVVCYYYDLTAQKKIQEKLRQSEERLRMATEAAEMFSWETDLIAHTIKWSENAAMIISCRPEDLPETIDDGMFFVAPEERERLFQSFEQDLSSGNKNYVIEFRGLNSLYWQAHGSIVRDSDGTPLRVFGVTQNITNRKLAEERIETANYRFRVAEEAVKGFVYEWNLKTGEVTRSKGVERLIGYRSDEIESNWQTWLDLIHPDDRIVGSEEEAIKFVSKLGEETFGGEYRLRHRNGHYIWVMERALIVYDEDKKPSRVIGQTLDISERKESEVKLLSAERRAVQDYRELLARIAPLAQTLGAARELRAVYGALLDFICFEAPCEGFFVSFYDEENQLKRVQYAWHNGVELDPQKLVPIPLNKTDGANSRAIRTGKSIVTTRDLNKIDGTFEVIGNDDRSRPTHSLVSPMIVSGRVVGTIEVQNHAQGYENEHIVAVEMAAGLAAVAIENVRLINIEAQARAAVEEASRAKDDFLAVLSHELRTPLNSIKGWVSILQNQRLDEEKQTRAIEVIARNVNAQNALIEDILDVSRIISGKMRLEFERLSFVLLLQNTVDAMRPVAEQKNVSLELAADATADEMDGDAFRLQQVINNLLSNAVKFTPPHGVIKISLERRGDFAELVVADSGIGIAPELLPRIFDRFQQAERTSKRQYGGLGLGLAIVQSLVELHGGTISVTSAGEGEGATFTVRLPLIPQMIFPFPDVHSSGAPLSATQQSEQLKGVKLLVVDDDADTLEMMGFVLESYGASVAAARTAAEALEILSGDSFHLIISDIGLSGSDGYDLIKSVREKLHLGAEVLPALALSGLVSVDDRERAARAGFQLHLGKPVDLEALPSLILRLVKK